MNIDYIAMSQGIGDALDAGEIEYSFYLELLKKVGCLTFVVQSGRPLIRYIDLLQALATVVPTNDRQYQMVCLWRRLGTSIASGISVASQE